MKTRNILYVILLLISLSIIADAQVTVSSATSGSFISAIVKNLPYSAESNTEIIRILADGNRIIRKSHSVDYRDSEGRTRIESFKSDNLPGYISIIDPITGKYYSLNPELKTGFVVPYIQSLITNPNAKSSSGSATTKPKTLATVNVFIAPTGNPTSGTWTLAEPRTGYSSKTENIGTRTIEGLEATGTRTVTTIAAGAIGNERAIESVSEIWYSKDLRQNILVKRNDPQTGEYTLQLTNIKRTEPDKSLFIIPADYKITDRTVTSKQE